MRKILALLCITFLFCTGCTSSPRYHLVTASTSGALYPLGAAMAESFKENGIDVRCEASAGGLDNLHLLRTKEADLGFAVASIAGESFRGEGIFEGYRDPNLRVVAALYANPNQVVVKKDIKSLKDLKGKRLAAGSAGSTTDIEARLHLQAIGLTAQKDVQWDAVGLSEGADLLRDRQTDALWVMSAAPTATVAELLASGKTKLLSFDDRTLDATKSDTRFPYIIKKGLYGEDTPEIKTTAVRMLFLCRSDLDEETVYQLTKTFWQDLEKLKASNKALKEVNIQNAASNLGGIPLHKGAERYYKENGVVI